MSKNKDNSYFPYSNNDSTSQSGSMYDDVDNADLYNDDFSRKAVGRLFNDDVRVDENYKTYASASTKGSDAEDGISAYDETAGVPAGKPEFKKTYAGDEYTPAGMTINDEDLAYREYIASVSETLAVPRPMPKRPAVQRDATKSPVYHKIEPTHSVPVEPVPPQQDYDKYDKYDKPNYDKYDEYDKPNYDKYDEYDNQNYDKYDKQNHDSYSQSVQASYDAHSTAPGKPPMRKEPPARPPFGLLAGNLKLILAGVGILFLIIMVILVIKINADGAELKRLRQSLETAESVNSNYQALVIEHENLKNLNTALEDELRSLQNNPVLPADTNNVDPAQTSDVVPTDSTNTASPTPTIEPTTTPSAAPTATPTAPAASTRKQHTVVAGDSFWGLAVKYYNNGQRGADIMRANGITSETSLRVGQVLIIPD